MAQSALGAVQANHLNPRVVSVPRPSATPQEIAQANAQGHVSPLYFDEPAPVGVADMGLSAGPKGSVVPSILNTTSLRGQINTGSAGIYGLDLSDSDPDSYGMQMNAVLSNVTLFGQSGYSFWTQDIALYFPASQELYLDSNIWNWSGGPLTPNVFYQHGPYGYQVDESFYYAFIGPFTVSYPFQLTFYLNSTVTDGRDAVYFGAHITSLAGDVEFPFWDYAIFNSTAPGGSPLTEPSNYTASGFQYNPVGETDDFELILGGPNGGSQADLVSAHATFGLAYLSRWGYRDIPSAYAYGSETGETVTGATVTWSDAPGGPGGLPDYGVVSTGPVILTGLWNAGGREGAVPVALHIEPSNAFVFLNASSNAYTVSLPEYAPTLTTSTLFLSPGVYRYTVELSDYAPSTGTLVVHAPNFRSPEISLVVTLGRDLRFGIYTPLFAWENSQLPAISFFGSGSPFSPYVLFNNQYAPLGPSFGVVNDYGYPVFPGVLLVGTSQSVELSHPANFLSISPDVWDFGGAAVPPWQNALPLWFSGVSHVAIVGGTNITGYFDYNVYSPGEWTPFDVVFYNSDDNLVASNVFNVAGGGGLLLFGGSGNTVWGNTFNEVVPYSPTIFPILYGLGIGIQVAESGDLIYDNNIETPTTAWQLNFNLYTGVGELFDNAWNITPQPAWHVHFAHGFPLIPLVGSIVGTNWQGGNFWWDYGLTYNPYNGADNPYGVLPYTENGVTPTGFSPYIYPGGDYAPLT